YQSASGAGKELVWELEGQIQAIAGGRPVEHHVYPHQLAHNVVPGGWPMEDEGYNEEETKLRNETRKILHLPELRIAATCVRVPVPIAHGESVFLETEEPLGPTEARELLAGAPGVVVQDDPAGQGYPTPAAVVGTDEVFVGRVRRDLSQENGLALWIVADNLRKGAALNAVQVAERAIQEGVL
ncbi:MAG: aspartate-semialdehyde dehydrogenase, partial [Candidatus Dormibacteraceae bacterium]